MILHTLIYVSSATWLFSDEEIKELLSLSMRNNQALHVTGIPLYKDGNFMQLLEGTKETVFTLFHKISRDPRHEGVLKLIDYPMEKRDFGEWSMSFCDLNDPSVRDLPGYSEFLDLSFREDEFLANADKGVRLLKMFKRNIR